MSWVNDLASAAGIPAGAATLAAAMYAACTAAEKAGRPEALNDIGRILKDTTWERSVRPSAIIGRMFVWTFGERHFSVQCIERSVVASLIFLVCFVASMYFVTSRIPLSWGTVSQLSLDVAFGVPVGMLIPDYLALGKTRMLLRLIPIRPTVFGIIFLVLSDIVLSPIISYIAGMAVGTIWFRIDFGSWNYGAGNLPLRALRDGLDSLKNLADSKAPEYQWWGVCFLSTLLTSIWTILILLSTTVLKLLAPVHQFTAWFFDVEKHPVQAIGIVAGALVMLGSLIWSVLRAVI